MKRQSAAQFFVERFFVTFGGIAAIAAIVAGVVIGVPWLLAWWIS